MAIEAHSLAAVISCHAWNKDATQLALCPNTTEVHVYSTEAGKPWERTAILKQHDQLVSGVDWCHRTGRLVTCSHDCNAYVWTWAENNWRPEMVITRLKRAALCVHWSSCGTKFAIGGTGKEVSVCYTDASRSDEWWAAKLISRSHSSAVTGVAWHPSGEYLATSSTDAKCRVFSAHVSTPQQGAGQQQSAPYGKFGDAMLEVDTEAGWATAVAWSPSGSHLAFSSHKSQVAFLSDLDAAQPQSWSSASCQRLKLDFLPQRAVKFLAEDLVATGGFDGEALLLGRSAAGQWAFLRKASGGRQLERAALAERQIVADFSAKLAMFKSPTGKAAYPEGGGREDSAKPVHSNAIVDICCIDSRHSKPGRQFSTAGWDGQVVLWSL